MGTHNFFFQQRKSAMQNVYVPIFSEYGSKSFGTVAYSASLTAGNLFRYNGFLLFWG
jgi:hypothetical protein